MNIRLIFLLLFCCCVSGCGGRDRGPVFDVPSLLGKNIDQVTTALGPPTSEVKDGAAPQRTWTKDGVTLTATWKPSSKRVTEWSLLAREDKDALSEEQKAKLLVAGQLPESDARYSVDWIEAKERPLFYVGARISPASKTHNVSLKLTGATAMVMMSYQPAPQGNAGNLLNVTPWETSFTAEDNTRLFLAASLEKNLGRPGVFEMKAEIWVDGKKVQEAVSKGLPVAVEYEI